MGAIAWGSASIFDVRWDLCYVVIALQVYHAYPCYADVVGQ